MFFVSLLIIIFISTSSISFEIIGDSAIINTTKAWINVTPQTVSVSCGNNVPILLEGTNKVNSTNMTLVFAYNSNFSRPVSFEQWNPHTEELNYTCNHEFNFTTDPNYAYCFTSFYNETTEVNSTHIYFERTFDRGNQTLKTVWWNETINWTTVNKPYFKINRDFKGRDTFYLMENISFIQNEKRLGRINLTTNRCISFNQQTPQDYNAKYDVALYPSSYGKNFKQAADNNKLYLLDPNEDLDTGLQVWYEFDDGGDLGDNSDSTDFTLNSTGTPTSQAGHISNSSLVNGTNYWVHVDTPWHDYLHSRSNGTVTFWANVTATGDGTFYCKRESAGAFSGMFYFLTRGGAEPLVLTYEEHDGSSYHTLSTSDTHDLNKYYFYALQHFDNNTTRVWVNDTVIMDGVFTNSGNLDGNTDDVWMGDCGGTGDKSLYMDNFNVYDRILTDAEILDMYNNGVGVAYDDRFPVPTYVVDSNFTNVTTAGGTINFSLNWSAPNSTGTNINLSWYQFKWCDGKYNTSDQTCNTTITLESNVKHLDHDTSMEGTFGAVTADDAAPSSLLWHCNSSSYATVGNYSGQSTDWRINVSLNNTEYADATHTSGNEFGGGACHQILFKLNDSTTMLNFTFFNRFRTAFSANAYDIDYWMYVYNWTGNSWHTLLNNASPAFTQGTSDCSSASETNISYTFVNQTANFSDFISSTDEFMIIQRMSNVVGGNPKTTGACMYNYYAEIRQEENVTSNEWQTDGWVQFPTGVNLSPSNSTKTVTSTVNDVVGWCFSANNTLGNLNETNCESNEFYFNTTSGVDISFTMKLPLTGCTEDEGSTDATEDCEIAFFETTDTVGLADETDVAAQGQTSTIPFFNLTNDGEVNINWSIKWNTDPGSQLNAKYDLDNNPTGATTITNGYTTINGSIPPGNWSEAWVWGDFTNAEGQKTNVTSTHQSSEAS